MKKFTFWRNAIVSELYVVDAATEEEAREMLQNGEVEVFNPKNGWIGPQTISSLSTWRSLTLCTVWLKTSNRLTNW
jgi:hypothetical protein